MTRGRPPEASASRNDAPDKDWVCLAVVGAPKGVRGALRLTCYNENPREIAAFNPLHAGPGGREISVRVIETPKPGQVIVKIDGIEDRDAAAALNGTRLHVPRERMPAPEDDEFYHHDLIGLPVFHVDGRELGRAKAIVDYGAGDVLEVLAPDRRSSFLVPFTRENVPGIDLEAGRITVDPPLGVFDDD